MARKVIFTVLTVTVLGGGCFLYINHLLKDKEKFAHRMNRLYDDRDEAE